MGAHSGRCLREVQNIIEDTGRYKEVTGSLSRSREPSS